LLPETFTTGFLGDQNLDPETMDGATVAWMRHQASALDVAVAGSVVIGEDGGRYNRFLFVTPDGKVAHYDKRHLFAYGGEHKRYLAGDRREIVEFRGWRICLQVCYDLRFPVWCRNRNDYDLMVFVANWPAKRVNAWSALLRARAIENQACVIGINRVGEDGKGIEYPGLSAAYDGLGNPIVELGGEVACAIAELDLEELRKLRTELPFLADADDFHIKL
ncbi:MAG: amidohydrolase, partial [Xanthomonadales bacterium]|nr:amidohydrolase [Xanthomonadales bacterium]